MWHLLGADEMMRQPGQRLGWPWATSVWKKKKNKHRPNSESHTLSMNNQPSQPKKVIYLSVGWFLLVVGLIMTPLPWPFGFGAPMAILGLVMLLTHSFWVRRRFVRLSIRYPKLFGRVKIFLRRSLPKLRRRFGFKKSGKPSRHDEHQDG